MIDIDTYVAESRLLFGLTHRDIWMLYPEFPDKSTVMFLPSSADALLSEGKFGSAAPVILQG